MNEFDWIVGRKVKFQFQSNWVFGVAKSIDENCIVSIFREFQPQKMNFIRGPEEITKFKIHISKLRDINYCQNLNYLKPENIIKKLIRK